jgi:hypothetical protein
MTVRQPNAFENQAFFLVAVFKYGKAHLLDEGIGLVELEVGSRLLMAEVVRRKIDSRPGKAAYGLLLGTLDRWHRFALSLGVERRTRQVPSIAEVMRGE